MKRKLLIPAFFLGSPIALIGAALVFQTGAVPAGVALLIAPVITTAAALQVLRRI